MKSYLWFLLMCKLRRITHKLNISYSTYINEDLYTDAGFQKVQNKNV